MSKPAELTLVVDRDGSTTSPGSVSPRHVIPSQTEDETLSALPAPLIAAEPAQSQQSPRKNPQHGRTAAPSKKPDKAKTSTPYRSSPAISERSISQGNLLETESIGGSSVHDDGASETGQSQSGGRNGSIRSGGLKHLLKMRGERNATTGNRDPPRIQTGSRERRKNDKSRERTVDTIQESPQTAPLSPDRGFREASSRMRNRSAERAADGSGDHDGKAMGASRFTNFLNTSQRTAGDLGRAGKGMLNKMTRRGSTHDVEAPPENHVLSTVRLPLIEQVRKTRIRGDLQHAKDKTEYWLPALPYRCVDYLNSNGIEEEGLYRVPGSQREINHWRVRFDKEGDINLLDYNGQIDVNAIASLFKDWLRFVDPIFPKDTQERIARECESYNGGPTTPQMLKDELSKLPPYNYYLLFAITAHVTLVSKFSEVNKMSYNNLCVCFQQCMGLDAFVFWFLITDWRNCWQGCWTEKDYIEEEKVVAARDLKERVAAGEVSGRTISHPVPAAANAPERYGEPPSFEARPKNGRTKSDVTSGMSSGEEDSAPPSPRQTKRRGSLASLKAKEEPLKEKDLKENKLPELQLQPSLAPELDPVDPYSPIKM